MRETGNPDQWQDGYPARELVCRDIADGNCYVQECDGKICGVFTFIIGEDPTYGKIDGQWLNDEPYGTVHRIAGAGTQTGVLRNCLSFCSSRMQNVRIDTHENNAVMRHLLRKCGFTQCGVIYKGDGTTRIAYQKIYD